jgi:hypothetical protein
MRSQPARQSRSGLRAHKPLSSKYTVDWTEGRRLDGVLSSLTFLVWLPSLMSRKRHLRGADHAFPVAAAQKIAQSAAVTTSVLALPLLLGAAWILG